MIESPAHILPVAARTYGNKVALVTEDAQLSFNELEQRSNQLANALVGMGIQPGERVHEICGFTRRTVPSNLK